MKKEFILIVLVLLVFSLSGQNVKTDPTLAQIEKCNTNLDKANLLYNIYTDLENDFPDSAITYANQANKIYQILSKSKDDQISQQANKRIAYINHNLGRYHISKGAFDKALVNLSVSLPVFIKNRDSAKIAACYNNYGVVYESMGEYSKAINYYHQSLDIEEGENNTLGIATCYLNIGVVYYYQSDFSKAINYYENALELYETLGEQEYMTFCYVNIGILYDEQSKYELSYDYFQKALAVARKLQDKYVEGYCYSNMGSSYKKQKKYETSIAYYNKSLEVRRTIGDKQGEAVVIDNIANLNLIIAQSIDKPEIAKHHYSIALKYSKEALLMGQNIGLLPLQKTAYLNISEAYKGLKKYKQSLSYLQLYLETKDSLFSIEKAKQMEEFDAKYQAEKMQNKITLQQVQLEANQRIIKRKHLITVLLTMGLVLLFLLGITLLWSHKQKRKANLLLTTKNQEIILQKKEIEAKNQELENHRDQLENTVWQRTKDLVLAKEEAEESNRLKTAFLNNMSHEIRTPLNGITGFVELLQEPDIEPEYKQKYMDIISKSSNRLIATVTDIIEISKIEAGLIEVFVKEVSVNEMLKKLYDFFSLEAKNKGLQLRQLPGLSDDKAQIITDNFKLNGILTNMVNNAIKFTEKGSVTFGYEITTDSKSNPLVQFFVKDTGIGVPKDRQQAIFNHFEQADIEDIRAVEGSGLGLAIAKSYVEMLGGQIWLNSEEGVGTEFMFTIPYILSQK